MSELGGHWENKEAEIDSSDIIFGSDKNFGENIGSLKENSSTSNLDGIVKLLAKNKLVENIVIKKGPNKELLELLEHSVNAVVQEIVGKEIASISDSAEFERVISHLSPFAIAELAGALYHLKRDDDSEKLARLITEVQGLEIDVVAKANAYNTLGCIYLRQGAIKSSVEAHKSGLEVLPKEKRSLNEQWQANKLKYGILIDRMEQGVSADMPEKLFALKRERDQLGDTFNAQRVFLDAARASAALNNRDQAIRYALDAKDGMGAIGYWSGAEQADELFKSLQKGKKKK